MDNHPQLDVSIVTYNSELVVARCLASVLSAMAESNIGGTVFVVDNNSRDNTCNIVLSALNDFQAVGQTLIFLPQPDNGGWSSGHNVALANSDADFVLLLNPDALITADIILSMLVAFQKNAQLGALSPTLESNGVILASDFANHVPWKEIIRAFLPFRFRREHEPSQKSEDYFQKPDIVENRYLTGACLFVRRASLKVIAYRLDERYFMYADDEDLCRTIVKAGFKIAVLRQVVVAHSGDSSGLKLGSINPIMTGWKRYTYYMSLLELFNKWYGPLAFFLTKFAYTFSVSLRFFILLIFSRFCNTIFTLLDRTKPFLFLRSHQHSVNHVLLEYTQTRECIRINRFKHYPKPDEINGYLASVVARTTQNFPENTICQTHPN